MKLLSPRNEKSSWESKGLLGYCNVSLFLSNTQNMQNTCWPPLRGYSGSKNSLSHPEKNIREKSLWLWTKESLLRLPLKKNIDKIKILVFLLRLIFFTARNWQNKKFSHVHGNYFYVRLFISSISKYFSKTSLKNRQKNAADTLAKRVKKW